MPLSFSYPEQDYSLVQPKCSVFGECGGCLFQNISYQDELQIKENALKQFLIEQLSMKEGVFQPIVPSPNEYGYRSRLDLVLRRCRDGRIPIGFTKRDSRDVIELEACPIAMESISKFIPELKRRARELLPDKYRMASLTVRAGDEEKVCWGGIGKRSLKQTEGDYLWTEINGKRISYNMESFFQANLAILPKVIELIRKLSIWDKTQMLFDLYGGVGLFGIMLSDLVEKVVLVESVGASTDMARYNIKQLKLSNMYIETGTVEDKLPELLEQAGSQRSMAFVDPPRAGMKPAALQALAQATQLEHILYLSCNPVTLADDLKVLTEGGWSVQSVWPLDFFPKTRHLETLVLLTSS